VGESKLYIYDASDRIDRSQADGRFSGESELLTVGVGSIRELHQWLAKLVKEQYTFKRILFQTHGNSGMIFFNEVPITSGDLRTDFTGKGYDLLCPDRAKIYCDGCNVAEGKEGWGFLAALGQVFLRNQGGITMGYTSRGLGMPWYIPVVAGHTIHLWGDIKFIEFGSGAIELSRFNTDDASIPELIEAAQKLDSF
jgi:hypothetical protein